MPLAFARTIPAFVRSLIFCASTFAKDDPRIDRHAHRRRGGRRASSLLSLVSRASPVQTACAHYGMRTLRSAAKSGEPLAMQ